MSPLQFFTASGFKSSSEDGMDAAGVDRSGRVLSCLAVTSLLTSFLLLFIAPAGYTPLMLQHAYCQDSRSSFLFSARSVIETDWEAEPEPSPSPSQSLSPSPSPSPALPPPQPAGVSAEDPTLAIDLDSDSDSEPCEQVEDDSPACQGVNRFKKKKSASKDASKIEEELLCERDDASCITCAALRARSVMLHTLGAVSLMLCLATVGTALAAAMVILCSCCRGGRWSASRARSLSISSAVLGSVVFITYIAITLTLVNFITTTAGAPVPPQIWRLLLATFAPATFVLTVHVGGLSCLAHWIQHMAREAPPNAPVGPVLAMVHIV